VISESERPAEVNYNNLELEQSDVNETIVQEEKEIIPTAKATEDFEKEKASPLKTPKPPAQSKSTTKFQNELKEQIDRTRSLQESVKGIKKQLVRIDKTPYSVQKEHEVIRKKLAQFNSLQKRVDSIDKSIRTWKLKSAAIKRKTKPKLLKKKK
jgi:hypothetical protein